MILTALDPARPELLSVGKVQDGKWVLEEEKLRVAPEGSLAFICPSRKD